MPFQLPPLLARRSDQTATPAHRSSRSCTGGSPVRPRAGVRVRCPATNAQKVVDTTPLKFATPVADTYRPADAGSAQQGVECLRSGLAEGERESRSCLFDSRDLP